VPTAGEHSHEAGLRAALTCFRESGFHATTVARLVEATGLSWDEICALYGDKEGMFYAALDLLLAGPRRDESPDAPLEELQLMQARVRRLAFNSRLRALHRPVLGRLDALLDP
jgi:AcrR family transcriptional regulator